MRSWKSRRDRIGLRSGSPVRIQERFTVAGVEGAAHADNGPFGLGPALGGGHSRAGFRSCAGDQRTTARHVVKVGRCWCLQAFQFGEGLAVVGDRVGGAAGSLEHGSYASSTVGKLTPVPGRGGMSLDQPGDSRPPPLVFRRSLREVAGAERKVTADLVNVGQFLEDFRAGSV